MKSPLSKHQAAFTLIELLVVIGVIAILMGVVGLSMRGGGESAALQAGQRTLSGVVTVARSQATMQSESIHIAIDNRPESDTYLRQIWVLRAGGPAMDGGTEITDGDGNTITNWVPVGDPTRFRQDTFLVPPDDNVPPEMFANYEEPGGGDGRKSNGTDDEIYINHELTEVIRYSFNSRGFLTTNGRVVIAPGRRTPDGPVFENSERAVGMFIRQFGSTTTVSDARGFD